MYQYCLRLKSMNFQKHSGVITIHAAPIVLILYMIYERLLWWAYWSSNLTRLTVRKALLKIMEATPHFSMDSPSKVLFFCNLLAENSFPFSQLALNAKNNSKEGKMPAAFKKHSI